MSKLQKLFSQNKTALLFGLFFVLFFLFLPFQFLKLTTALAQNDFYCEKWGGIGYRCFGTVPLSACNNLIPFDCADDCDGPLGGDAARWGPSGNWEEGPFQWYCCNLPNDTNCFATALLAAPGPIGLASGTLPPPAPTNWWDNWNWGEKIENLGKNLLIGLPIAIVAIMSYFVMLLAWPSVTIGSTLMVWIIEASLNVFVVPGKAVEVVNIGWEVSRDLVNMVFLLILVFIGLATILRLKSYEVKKTLPLLVIMALLVNFSGVLVGTIVDISNLVTYSFIGGLDTFSSSISLVVENSKGLVGGLEAYFTQGTADPNTYIQSVALPLGKIITTAAFFCMLSITIFVIMLIFFLRTINLWIAVILAPIAFASYILPNTKGFWSWWSKNLIQWSIVGIPISFFLYLSNTILLNTGQINQAFGTGGSGWLATFIAQMMAPATVIMLLWFGIGLSLAGAPPAAQKMMEWGKKATVSTGKWVGKSIRESRPANKTEGFFRKRLESTPGLNRIPGFRRGDWEIEKNRRIEAAKKDIVALADTDAGNKAIAQRITQVGASREQIIQGIDTLAQRKELVKVENSKLIAMLKKVSSESNFNAKNVYKAAPHLAPYLNFKYTSPDPILTRTAPARDIAAAVEKINPGDLSKDVMKRTLEDQLVVANILADARKVTNMGRNLEAEKKRVLRNTAMSIPSAIFNDNFTPQQQAAIANNLTQIGGLDPNWQV